MLMRVWVSSLPHGDAKVRQFTENCRTSLLCFYDSINASYLQQNLVQKSERFLIAGYGKNVVGQAIADICFVILVGKPEWMLTTFLPAGNPEDARS